MIQLYPFNDNPAWADLKPIPQSTSDVRIVNIQSSDEFETTMSYFRAITEKNEISERAYAITCRVCELNNANYTAWHYKRILVKALKKDLMEEYNFIRDEAKDNPKNYQVWQHRRAIIEFMNNPLMELEDTADYIREDTKNYHVWSYRQWLLRAFSRELSREIAAKGKVRGATAETDYSATPLAMLPIWDYELAFAAELINIDVRNNSAWNQRAFVLRYAYDVQQASADQQTSDAQTSPMLPRPVQSILAREVEFVSMSLQVARHNESAWVYLTSLTRYPGFHSFSRTLALAKDVLSEGICVLGAAALVDILVQQRCPDYAAVRAGVPTPSGGNAWWGNGEPEEDASERVYDSAVAMKNAKVAIELCGSLANNDAVRFKYWVFRKQQIKKLIDVLETSDVPQSED